MPNTPTIQQANQAVADTINREALSNPQSPYAGKFVGIVGGKVAAVAGTLGDLVGALEQQSADRNQTFIIEAGVDYDKVIEIWSV